MTIVGERIAANRVDNPGREAGGGILTYRTLAESATDKAHLLRFLKAINGAKSAACVDKYPCWQVCGWRGKLYTGGDGKTWLLHTGRPTPKRWNLLKRRLLAIPGTILAQDSDDEGVIRFTAPPTTKHAGACIRSAIGLRVNGRTPLSGATSPFSRRDVLDLPY